MRNPQQPLHFQLVKKLCLTILSFTAEISRLEKEKAADLERFEHQKDQLNQRLQQLERDSQMALAQEKQAHEEDVERLTTERVQQS